MQKGHVHDLTELRCTLWHLHVLLSLNWTTKGNVSSLIPSFSNVNPTVFLHNLFLENKAQTGFKKHKGNALKFISNQLAKFGPVLSKNKNRPKIVSY